MKKTKKLSAKLFLISLLLFIPVLVQAEQKNSSVANLTQKSTASSSHVSWTDRPFLNNPMDFQFAIVSDRTGGHRTGVFSRAMHQVNLLQPEFVMSVGDLIEGATTNLDILKKEFNEMDSFLNTLKMRFFRVPGNHDIGNKTMLEVYRERYGSPYYHFIYKDVLFLIVSTEDPPVSTISDAQVEYVKKVLQDNKNVRWTCVFMHEPLFMKAYDKKNQNWLKIEKMLQDRPYNLFAGHYHGYAKFVRNGHKYIRLATTGGASNLSGVKNGAIDHVMWVTMTDKGPLIANIALSGLYDEDLKAGE